MRRWVKVFLVLVVVFIIVAAIFITIGVLATPKGGSEGLSSLGTYLML
jgi:hypothetical protein